MAIFSRKAKTKKDEEKKPGAPVNPEKATAAEKFVPRHARADSTVQVGNMDHSQQIASAKRRRAANSMFDTTLSNASYARDIAHSMAHGLPSPTYPGPGQQRPNYYMGRDKSEEAFFANRDGLPMPTPSMQSALAGRSRVSRSSSDSFGHSGAPPSIDTNLGHGKRPLTSTGFGYSNYSSDSGYESAGPQSAIHSRAPSEHGLQDYSKSYLSRSSSGFLLPELKLGDVPMTEQIEPNKSVEGVLKYNGSVSPLDLASDSRSVKSIRLTTSVSKRTRFEDDPDPMPPLDQLEAIRNSSSSTAPLPQLENAPLIPERAPARVLPIAEHLPPLILLEGLKVNKKGQILDEEGDPIGELVEGDLLDCVRQKVNGSGEVLDEYGRVVGTVRTVARAPAPALSRPDPQTQAREEISTDAAVQRTRPQAPHVEMQSAAPTLPVVAPSQPALQQAEAQLHPHEEILEVQSKEWTQPPLPRVESQVQAGEAIVALPAFEPVEDITTAISSAAVPDTAPQSNIESTGSTEMVHPTNNSPNVFTLNPVALVHEPTFAEARSTSRSQEALATEQPHFARAGDPTTIEVTPFARTSNPKAIEVTPYNPLARNAAAPRHSPRFHARDFATEMQTPPEPTRRSIVVPRSASERSLSELSKPFARPTMSSVPENNVPDDDIAPVLPAGAFSYKGDIDSTIPDARKRSNSPPSAMRPGAIANVRRVTTQYAGQSVKHPAFSALKKSDSSGFDMSTSGSETGTDPSSSDDGYPPMMMAGHSRSASLRTTGTASTSKPRTYFTHGGKVTVDANDTTPKPSMDPKPEAPAATAEEKKGNKKKSRMSLGFGRKTKAA
ncbi:hypothetical protein AC579_9644 [Pseudocercospora musae]|uniref:Uncharacterized protein n=1 Tax=Pseudocercospora musae TaxID=113226 RepID=A0A139IJI1_9PEZI|nr:hypothetical protein AC579_9644 [Pseudocercospora musae]